MDLIYLSKIQKIKKNMYNLNILDYIQDLYLIFVKSL